MNFRNNFYPNNNVHGAPVPMVHNQMQRNIRPDMQNSHMDFNMNPHHRGGMQQRFIPNRYDNYNNQMQNNPSFAYDNSYRDPGYGNNLNQYNDYNYSNPRFNNRDRIQHSGENIRESYDRFSAPIREARRSYANSSNYNSDDEYYNYNDYSRPMLRNEDSRSTFRNSFFTRLGASRRNQPTYEDDIRSDYREEVQPKRLSRKSKSRYEDEYDDYEDEEEYREERRPKKLSKRSKSRYEDEYDDYEDEEEYREERRPKKLSKRSKSRYEDEYDDYEDEEEYREERRPKKLSRRSKSRYEDEYDDYEDEEEYREERRPKKLSKRSKSRYEDEYDDYEDDDNIVERKRRFLPGPINFFKKKRRG